MHQAFTTSLTSHLSLFLFCRTKGKESISFVKGLFCFSFFTFCVVRSCNKGFGCGCKKESLEMTICLIVVKYEHSSLPENVCMLVQEWRSRVLYNGFSILITTHTKETTNIMNKCYLQISLKQDHTVRQHLEQLLFTFFIKTRSCK